MTHNKMKKVLWFTGLSGSGKTTIAFELKKQLEVLKEHAVIIDGDDVRNELHKHLDFSREGIQENNRLIAKLAKEELNTYDIVIAPIISPCKKDREMVRKIIGSPFILVYINASLETCIARDTKGMYEKAKKGGMDNLIGMSKKNPYEPPIDPDIEIRTDTKSVNKNVQEILHFLKSDKIN